MCSIDGKGTLHAMGMIASVTPGVKLTTKVLRSKVTSHEILEVANVNIFHLFDEETDGNPSISLRPLKPGSPLSEISTDIDLL